MSPLKTMIKPINRTRTFDYRNESLGPCWLKTEIKKYTMDEESGTTRKFIIAGPKLKLLNNLVDMVDSAKELVCCSSFLIQKSPFTDSLLRASQRGVNVYLLTAREEELKKIDEDMSEFEKEVIPKHKKLLDSLAGNVLVRSAQHFHSKFLLIDPKSDQGKGFLMTCNATVDAMTGNNIEVGVNLTQTEVKSFFSQFIQGFWMEANHELFQKGELSGVGKLNYFEPKIIPPSHPCTIGDQTLTLREKIIELISSAHKNIIISGWTLQNDCRVMKDLLSKLNDGVKVTIYTRPSEYNTESLLEMSKKGAQIFGNERFHVKAISIDDDQGLIMTSNITSRGLDSGFESAVCLEGDELKNLNGLFNNWKDNCSWNLKSDITLGNATDDIKLFDLERTKNRIIDINIENENKVKLDEYQVNSIEEMETFEPKFPNIQTELKKYRSGKFEYTVIPPELPGNAKPVITDVEIERPLTKEEINDYKKKKIKDIPKTKKVKESKPIVEPFPLFKTKKKYYVGIKYLEDAPAAKIFAKQNNAAVVVIS